MFILNHKKLKKLILTLFLVGIFFFSFVDFSYAKTKQEWLSEINQLLSDPNSDVIKDKEQWLSELEQVAQEETQKRSVEIECVKNPETCPLPLNPLAIDENGNIEGTEVETTEARPLSDNIIEKLKQALSSLGIAIENGIVKVKEIIVEKITTKKICLEGDDGETICVDKAQLKELLNKNGGPFETINNNSGGANSNCDNQHLDLCTSQELCEGISLYWYNETCNAEPFDTAQGEPETPDCIPGWSCADWQPLPETVACGETFTQTRTCTDLNNCGTDEGKPAENQEVVGADAITCGTTSCDASLNLAGECQNPCQGADGCGICTPTCACAGDYSDCDSDLTNGCETQSNCPTVAN